VAGWGGGALSKVGRWALLEEIRGRERYRIGTGGGGGRDRIEI
jgi:hypothetical protein